jgi:DNA-binding CsgD family transcriptional regulator
MDLARNKTYKEIAKIMGRSHDSIERKFGRLQDRQRLLHIKEVTYANNTQ